MSGRHFAHWSFVFQCHEPESRRFSTTPIREVFRKATISYTRSHTTRQMYRIVNWDWVRELRRFSTKPIREQFRQATIWCTRSNTTRQRYHIVNWDWVREWGHGPILCEWLIMHIQHRNNRQVPEGVLYPNWHFPTVPYRGGGGINFPESALVRWCPPPSPPHFGSRSAAPDRNGMLVIMNNKRGTCSN